MTTMTAITSTDGVFTLWQHGRISASAALRTLWDDLRQIEAAQQQLEARRSAVRDQLGQIADQLGGKATLAGYGTLEILTATTTTSYDKSQVDALIIALAAEHPAIAARLAACRTERPRAGGLRVTPEPPRR